MKRLLMVIACLSVSMVAVSCMSSHEARGDRAYEAAKSASGGEKRHLEKTAYVMYRYAVREKGDNVSTRLRNRYVEMVLTRTHMMLQEGTASLDALPLFRQELDEMWKPDIPAALGDSYAELLVGLADSSFDQGRITDGIAYLDRAVEVAGDKGGFRNRKQVKIDNLINNTFDIAAMEYEDGLSQKDEETLLRAEYHTKLVLDLDSTHEKAEELLSKIYRANTSTYSAYVSVISHRPDTALFRRINKLDILLAVPSTLNQGGNVLYQVAMYNYSYNPLRLRAPDFFLEDVNGRRYPARASGSRIQPEILDQEHETTLRLLFPRPAAAVKRLVYVNGDHYSEKNFL